MSKRKRVVDHENIVNRVEDAVDLKEEEAKNKRLRQYDPIHAIPRFEPGELNQIMLDLFANAGKFVTKVGHGVSDFALRQDGSEIRELHAAGQEARREIEEHAKSLRQGKETWQRESAEVLESILKLPSGAMELYEDFPEFPLADNFEKHGDDKDQAAKKRENRVKLINDAYALYYCALLKELNELNVTSDSGFEKVEHFRHALEVKKSEAEDLSNAAKECVRQGKLAQYRETQSQKRDKESAENAESIKNIPGRIWNGFEDWEYLRTIGKCKKQADARVAELEEILEDVRKRRQDTNAKIEAHRSQAQKRMNAGIDANARFNAFAGNNGIQTINRNRFLVAGARSVQSRQRATALNGVGVRTQYKDIAERKRLAIAAVPLPAVLPVPLLPAPPPVPPPPPLPAADAAIVANFPVDIIAEGGRRRQMDVVATNAERNAKEAKQRARDAETRARIIQSYKNDKSIAQNIRDAMDDQAANDTAEHTKAIAKLEGNLAENARKMENNNRKIRNAISDIRYILAEIDNQFANMNRLITDPTKQIDNADLEALRVADLQRACDASIQKFVAQIEGAEKEKNNAIEDQEKLAEKQALILRNINNKVIEERDSLGRERATETLIANQSVNDLNHLNALEVQQRQFEEVLAGRAAAVPALAIVGLIQREQEHATSMDEIRAAIAGRGGGVVDLTSVPNPAGGANLDLKARARMRRTRVRDARMNFHTALRNLRVAEEDAAKVLKRNAIHMEQEIPSDAEQILEALEDIEKKQTAQDGEKQKARSKGHLMIYTMLGTLTLGDNATWMKFREIFSYGKTDHSQKSTGKTRLEFRPDIVEIEKIIITREGKEIRSENVYTKRLSGHETFTDNLEYQIVIPGDTFAADGRRNAYLKIVDRKKVGTANPAGGVWTEADCTRTKPLNMEGVSKIQITEDHNQSSTANDPPVAISVNTETMPSPEIDHLIALSRRQGTGWTDEDKRQMWKLDLDDAMLRLPTSSGWSFPIRGFALDDTEYDKENGLTLHFSGPKTVRRLNLQMAGTLETTSPKLLDMRVALMKTQRAAFKHKIEWLKKAVKSCDKHKIDNAFELLKASEGMEANASDKASSELQIPPSSVELMKNAKKRAKDLAKQSQDGTPQWVADITKSTAEMRQARRSYENKVKERVRMIHRTTPLTSSYVYKCRAQPERYNITEHKSSEEKLKLWNEIASANDLDKRIDFNLLEDPKLNAPVAAGLPPVVGASPVKNARPNGLELLREYNMYKGIRHPNVERYVKDIITQFETNQDIPVDFKNTWNVQRAEDALHEGNLLGKTVNGRHIDGVKDYIQKLVRVDYPMSDDSFDGLRQADEYHWVTYLQSALGNTDDNGIPQGLKQALTVAKRMQVSRFNNLECAKKALDLETPTEEAEKILNKIIIEDPLVSSYATNKQGQAKVDVKDKEMPFNEWHKKGESEMAKDTEEILEKMFANNVAMLEGIYEKLADPGLKTMFKQAMPDLLKELNKASGEIFKQNREIALRATYWLEYGRRLKELWWRDFITTLALLWVRSFTQFGSTMANGMIGEMLKLALKNL